MVAIVIATHGAFAPALLESSKMIIGESTGTVPVTFSPGEGPDDLLKKYASAVEELSEYSSDGVLFLVDLFGGSPYNAAARFVATRENMDVVTGVNLPMIIDLYVKRLGGSSLSELVSAAETAGRDGVRVFSEVFAQQELASVADDEGDELS